MDMPENTPRFHSTNLERKLNKAHVASQDQQEEGSGGRKRSLLPLKERVLCSRHQLEEMPQQQSKPKVTCSHNAPHTNPPSFAAAQLDHPSIPHF